MLLAIVFLVYSGVLFQSKGERSEWNECFVRASQHMLAHEPIHRADEGWVYSYPPSMALLAAPLAGFSTTGSLLGWWAANMAAAGAWFVCSWRLAGGPSVLRVPLVWSLILAVGFVTNLRWTLTTIEHQQFDLVIAALLMGGCCLCGAGIAWDAER